VITEHRPFCSHCKGHDFTFTEDSQFVILDNGLDATSLVREHRMIRPTFYITEDIRKIPLTPLHVVTSARPFHQIQNPFPIRVRGRRRKKGRIDTITIAIQVNHAQNVNVEPSRSETVEGTSRPLKSIDDVKCGHRLAFRMLGVGDRVTDNLQL